MLSKCFGAPSHCMQPMWDEIVRVSFVKDLSPVLCAADADC
jgi:hypothetical protein